MKDSTIKFQENACSGSGQTDRRKNAHDEGNTNFSLVCERAKKGWSFPATRHEGM